MLKLNTRDLTSNQQLDFDEKQDDVIEYGAKILEQIDGSKDISIMKIRDMIEQLNIQFDIGAINNLN
jgi:hypothetical protein